MGTKKQSLKGKRIFLWSEQGVGDTINWSSCLALVASKAEHCILECQQKLVPLLARSFPNVEVKPKNRSLDSERDDFDFHIPLGSLFRCLFPKIPGTSKTDAFLVPDPVRIKFWTKQLKSLGNGPLLVLAGRALTWRPSVYQTMPQYPNGLLFSRSQT